MPVEAARGRDPARARIAIYDAPSSSPRVEEVHSEDIRDFIEALSQRAYTLAREQGGGIPYTAVREVVENLLHASFRDVVVSILDSGTTVRFSDSGPGIGDKKRAFLPGFTTADDRMRHYIRGVGSGLPIVRESVSFSGGFVEVEDNLGRGTVVTVTVPSGATDFASRSIHPGSPPSQPNHAAPGVRVDASVAPALHTRQKQVLSLVMELASVGPTRVSRELGVGLSTAYRDLAFLEEAGLLSSDVAGKRVLTDRGVEYLDTLID